MNTFLAGLLFSTALLNTKPAPVFADVFIGSSGPYRFLVDTGAQTSFITPKLASDLRLQPEFRVEIITQNSTGLFPARKVRNLTVGGKTLPETEIVFHEVQGTRRLDSSVQGLLGLNALAGLNFTLSPPAGRLDLTAERPAGETIPYSRVEDRIALKATMGGEALTLLLDSGSTHVVLFRVPRAMEKTPPISAIFGTIDGARAVVPTTWTAEMTFKEGVRLGMMPAAMVRREGTEAAGLLPASAFKAIYVDQARSELVLVR